VYSVASTHGWGRLKEGKAAWSREKRAQREGEKRGVAASGVHEREIRGDLRHWVFVRGRGRTGRGRLRRLCGGGSEELWVVPPSLAYYSTFYEANAMTPFIIP
jgi:hypothetical protein